MGKNRLIRSLQRRRHRYHHHIMCWNSKSLDEATLVAEPGDRQQSTDGPLCQRWLRALTFTGQKTDKVQSANRHSIGGCQKTCI